MKKQGCAAFCAEIRLVAYRTSKRQAPCFIAQSRIHKKLEKLRESRAAGFEMRNRGFQGAGAGIYLSGNEQARAAESAIYRSKPTPFKRNNASA